MNAVLNYLAIVFLFKTLQQITSFKIALIVSLFFGCYFNSLEFIALMYSESLTLFLIALLGFLIVKAFDADKLKTSYWYIAGITMGYLALTKVIFGYVVLCMLIICLLLWLINRRTINYRKSVFILLVALATTMPYLVYTYSLTGKVFYWGTTGGNNLYWMSTPYENEYGNWIPDQVSDPKSAEQDAVYAPQKGGVINLKNRDNSTPDSDDSLYAHHREDYVEIDKYVGIERDEAYKKILFKNIKSHPVKYIENCISNVGRILFNYPYSYTYQKPATLFRLPFNGIIVVLALFCIIPTLINWRKLQFSVRFLLFFVALYLGSSILGSAETRMFTVIVPLLLFWITYICQRAIKIKLKFTKDINDDISKVSG